LAAAVAAVREGIEFFFSASREPFRKCERSGEEWWLSLPKPVIERAGSPFGPTPAGGVDERGILLGVRAWCVVVMDTGGALSTDDVEE
jgi:hypothetical protein